jgi:hypothetical protein
MPKINGIIASAVSVRALRIEFATQYKPIGLRIEERVKLASAETHMVGLPLIREGTIRTRSVWSPKAEQARWQARLFLPTATKDRLDFCYLPGLVYGLLSGVCIRGTWSRDHWSIEKKKWMRPNKVSVVSAISTMGGGGHVILVRGVRSPSPSDPGDAFQILLSPLKGIGLPGMRVPPIKELVGESIDVIDGACFA